MIKYTFGVEKLFGTSENRGKGIVMGASDSPNIYDINNRRKTKENALHILFYALAETIF